MPTENHQFLPGIRMRLCWEEQREAGLPYPDGGCPGHVIQKGQLPEVPLVFVAKDCLKAVAISLYEGTVDTSLHHIEKVTVVMLAYDELSGLHLVFEHGVNHVS